MRETEVKKLYDGITNVKDEFVEEAQAINRKEYISIGKPHLWRNKHLAWAKWCALAASLCLVAGIGALVQMNLRRAGIAGGSNGGSYHSNANGL